jgi:hypothetical protein
MAKFRQGNLVLTSTQVVKQGDNTLTMVPTPDTDHSATGHIVPLSVDSTTSVVFGNLLYAKSTGNLELADASAEATVPAMALALESGNGNKNVLLHGFARNDTWNWTPGGFLYVSTIEGDITQTAPSGSGEQVQIIGIATHADRIYFAPNYSIIEIA